MRTRKLGGTVGREVRVDVFKPGLSMQQPAPAFVSSKLLIVCSESVPEEAALG